MDSVSGQQGAHHTEIKLRIQKEIFVERFKCKCVETFFYIPFLVLEIRADTGATGKRRECIERELSNIVTVPLAAASGRRKTPRYNTGEAGELQGSTLP